MLMTTFLGVAGHMKASEWIDRLKAEKGWESDYRVAKELELSRQTVSTYRSKPDATMDDDTSCRVAKALGAAPELIILDQVAERTKSEPARAAIARAIKRLGGAVAGGVFAIGLALPAPAPAAQQPDEGGSVYYVKSRRKRRRADPQPDADQLPFFPASLMQALTNSTAAHFQ